MTQPPGQPPYGNDPYGYPPPSDPYGAPGPADPYTTPVSPDPSYEQYPGQTGQAPTYPGYPGQYPVAYPPVGPPEQPRRKRTGLIVSLVVILVVLLCGGGAATAYLLVENNKPAGADTPVAAVDGFLTAVFKNKNASEAGNFVCESARDSGDLNQLVSSVSEFEKKYESPKTTWKTPTVENTKDGEAAATVKLTFTTGDERASEKNIKLVLVEDKGWWVCDVQAV